MAGVKSAVGITKSRRGKMRSDWEELAFTVLIPALVITIIAFLICAGQSLDLIVFGR